MRSLAAGVFVVGFTMFSFGWIGGGDAKLATATALWSISDQSIRIRSNSDLRNVLLGSRGSVAIDSNVTIGDADFCQTGNGSALIISAGGVTGEQVETGSNIALHGVQMVSDGNIVMNSNLTITAASMQTTGDISLNSSFEVAGCPEGTSANVTGNGTKVAQLVD